MSEARSSTVEYEVRGYDCGYGGPLSVFSLANFIQEAAGVNAQLLGFGMEDMGERNWTWMLSRLDIRVDELPREGERVSVTTWPSEVRKLFALRDFEMKGADGRSLVRAVYAYLVVDLAARKPLRPSSVFGDDPPAVIKPHPVADYSFDQPAVAEWVPAFAQLVRGRHIDHNGHANNAHIVNWLADAAAESRASAQPKDGAGAPAAAGELSALRVEFANEALEGDELLASRAALASSPFGLECAAVSTAARLSRGDAIVGRALVGWR
jgi:medium-chain acyl-[acyl-carrier-protein] hydrolase